MTFGENLKWLRTSAELSQGAFSKLTGLPQGSICKYEQGRIFPSAKTLKALETLARLPAFDLPAGKALTPAWFAPDIIQLPHPEFLAMVGAKRDRVGESMVAPPRPTEKATPDAIVTNSRSPSPVNGRRNANGASPEDRGYADPVNHRGPLKASTIHQPHWIEGIYAGVRHPDTRGFPDVFRFAVDGGGDGAVVTITRMGREPGFDRVWRGRIYQSPSYDIVIVGEPLDEPRELATWSLTPQDEPPYSLLAGREIPASPPPFGERGDVNVALLRLRDVETSDGAVAKLRFPDDALAADLRDVQSKLRRGALFR